MTTNHLKLYHSFSSPNSRRVRMFLAEKGLTVPLAPVDLAKGEQTLRCLPRYQSATRRAYTRFGMALRSVRH
jgi:glutathione S-transferase